MSNKKKGGHENSRHGNIEVDEAKFKAQSAQVGKFKRIAGVPKLTDWLEDHYRMRLKWHLNFTGHLPEQLWSVHLLAGVDNGTHFQSCCQ